MYPRKVLALLIGMMMLTTTVAAVGATPAGTDGGDQVTAEPLRVAGGELRQFDRLEIGKGSELVFYAMVDLPEEQDRKDDDKPGARIEIVKSDRDVSSMLRRIGIAQHIPVGGMDPMSVRELHGANPFEIYYALSERGTEIPGILKRYDTNRFERRAQGWALDQIGPSVYNLFSCKTSEQTVINAVNASGLPHNYNELSEGPHNGPFWYNQDPNSLFPVFYKNNGLATVGDAYFHVMLCEEDPTFAFTDVTVRLSYQESDNGQVLSSGELGWKLQNIGDQMSFMSWPFDSDMSGDNSWFWMLTVEDVHLYDTLHIGIGWS